MINTQCALSGKLETVPTKQTDLGLQSLLLLHYRVRMLHYPVVCYSEGIRLRVNERLKPLNSLVRHMDSRKEKQQSRCKKSV